LNKSNSWSFKQMLSSSRIDTSSRVSARVDSTRADSVDTSGHPSARVGWSGVNDNIIVRHTTP